MSSCPHCQSPILENAPKCHKCSLTVESATTLLGPVPELSPGLTDAAAILNDKQKGSITSAIDNFNRNIPESHLHIVLQNYDLRVNLSTQLFWLFNTAGLSPLSAQNEANQDILLGLDPSRGRVALIVGYGLEPFISQETVTELLETARPLLEEGQPTDAILKITNNLTILLRNAALTAQEAIRAEEPVAS